MVAALVIAAGLLMLGLTAVPGDGAKHQTAAVGTDGLSVAWASGATGLEITGSGFRPHSSALVKVGTITSTQVMADAVGAVRLAVHLESVAGLPGTSVVVTGRAPSGATRMLVAAAPPRAVGRGAADLIPWSVGMALIVAAVAAVPDRWLPRVLRWRGRRSPQSR